MNQISSDTEPAIIVIFGASGDLTQRKLVPALHTLACGGFLSPATRVIGVARSTLSDAAFRDRLYEGVVEYSRASPGVCELWPRFAGRHSYLAGDYDDLETYRRLAERLEQLDADVGTQGNCLFYLATPPVLYPVIVEQLGRAGLNRPSARPFDPSAELPSATLGTGRASRLRTPQRPGLGAHHHREAFWARPGERPPA